MAEYLTDMHSWRLGPFRDYQGEFRHTPDPGTPRALKIEPTGQSVAIQSPRLLRAVRVRFRVYSKPDQLNRVERDWRSPGAPDTHAAGTWTEGDGRLQEQLFWVWNDVASLTVSAYGAVEPRLDIEELAVFEGNAAEVP